MIKNKKFGVAAIIIIILILLIINANYKNNLVRQFQGPIEGTGYVEVVDNRLSIVSKNNHIYTWQWDNLKKWPVVAKPQAKLIAPFANDKIIYATTSKLILTDLKAEKEISSLSLPYGSETNKLKISADGNFAVISMYDNDFLKLALLDEEMKNLSVIFQKDKNSEKFSLYDFDITENADYLTGVGKKDKAWIFIKDLNDDKIIFEKTFDDHNQFTIAEFSPDGKTIYVAEKVRFILALDASNGNILRTYEMPEYPTPAHQKQNISCIAISPDGKILAADTEPAGKVWFWDIETGKKIDEIRASSLTVSDIAFSPDSKFMATGCLVSPEIKIWKVPQIKK